jgi:MFS family permease
MTAEPDRPTVTPVARRVAGILRPSGAFVALRHRNFRLFFYGQLVSLAGTWMQQIALSWLVLTVTNSAFYVGLVNALDALPVLLLALYAGVVVDRVSRHRLIITTQLSAMIFALILAVLVLTGTVRIGYVMILATLFGIVNAFDIPGRHTFYFDLVGREDLVSAVALNSVSFNATRIVGPAVAGMVLGIAGPGVCFLINGVSYLAVLWGLFQMKLPAPPPSKAKPGSAVRNILDGLGYIGRDRRMRTLLVVSALLTIFGSPFLVLLPIVAKHVLGRGAAAYGWMMAAVGLGALCGAVWVGGPGRRMGRGRIINWTSTLFGLLVMSLAVARAMPLVLVLLALIGFVMISSGAIVNTLLQVLAPDELRGRVVSVYTLVAVGFAPIGAVQAGAIAERWGAPAALAIGGSVCVVGVLAALLRTPELRELK